MMGVKEKLKDLGSHIKLIVRKLFKFEKCNVYKDKIDNLREENESLSVQLDKSLDKIDEMVKRIDELKSKLDKDNKENKLKEYWDNKHKKAIIKYPGRSLPFSKTKCEVPVNILITPLDPIIHKDLKKWGFKSKDEDWETLIPKLYKKIGREFYKYEYDKNTWGQSEVWEFPFELRQKGFEHGFDCDSFAILQVSYYRALGLPAWRVRVVAGECQPGGHATVYVFSKKDNRWHHLNSTYGSHSKYNELSNYPTHNDAENDRDKMGIHKVWFSFNDIHMWDDFGGETTIELPNRKKKTKK